MTQIVQSQNPNGSWNNKELVHKIAKDPQLAEQLGAKVGYELVVTRLVVSWFQKHHPGKEYALILKKAQAWLRKKTAEQGLDEAQLNQLESV